MDKQQLIQLVNRAKNGDTDATNELFASFYDDVYYFALKTVKDSDIACDITQETFLEIIRTIENLQEAAAFVTWMKQITYHQCTRYFRKKRDVLVDEDEDGNTLFDTLEDESADSIPVEICEKEDFRNTIMGIINELGEEQRSAVMLYYFDEMSVSQIAQIQGVSEGTVKSRLNYARKAIRKSVEDYEKKNGIKLHGIAFLPLFRILFSTTESMPASKAEIIRKSVSEALASAQKAGVSTASTAVSSAASAVAKKTAASLVTKIVSIAAVATIAVSGAVGVVTLPDKKDGNTTDAYVKNAYSVKDEQYKDVFVGVPKDPETVINEFLAAAFENYDAESVVSLMHKESVEAYCKKHNLTLQKFEDDLQSSIDRTRESMNSVLGSVEWELGATEECTQEELDKVRSYYKDLGTDVNDANKIDCRFKLGVIGIDITDIDETMCIVNIDDNWYLDIEETQSFGLF